MREKWRKKRMRRLRRKRRQNRKWFIHTQSAIIHPIQPNTTYLLSRTNTPYFKQRPLDKIHTSTKLHTWQHLRPVLLLCFARKHIPKSQCFVACSRHDCLSARVHSQKQNSARVPCKSGHFLERRILPHDNFVVRVSMCTYNFFGIFWEHQITDLRSCINAIK